MEKIMKYECIKRILDILISICLIIGLSPVLLITAILVKLESKGPIIFKQTRLGKNGDTFEIYKFRSMAKDNNVLNFEEKDKITRIGKFIRKYGIDELPQLFNIVKGDMSLIGPRPQLVKYLDYYTNIDKRRLYVLPGILGPNTCLDQKNSILEKNKLDVYYADNLSFKEDMTIVLIFIKNIVNIFKFREEGSEGNKVTVQEELECLEENYERIEKDKDKTKKVEVEYLEQLENNDELIMDNQDIKLLRTRKELKYGRKYF